MDDKKISQLPEVLSVGDDDYFVLVKEGATKKAKKGSIGFVKPSALDSYSLISETGNKIDLEINSQTYELVAKLYDKDDNLISTSSVIDLPIEQLVVNVSFDSTTNELIITLKNGTVVRVPIGAIISGLATETWVQTNFAPKSTTYTKTEVDSAIANHHDSSKQDDMYLSIVDGALNITYEED